MNADNILKNEFELTQEHINAGGTDIDDNPIVLSIKEHTDIDVFITPINLYATDTRYGTPKLDNLKQLEHAKHERICRLSKQMWRWLNDYESAWNDLLMPEPVTLVYSDGTLDIKGEYNEICDIKTYCEHDDVTNYGNCKCYACENDELDLEIWRHRHHVKKMYN